MVKGEYQTGCRRVQLKSSVIEAISHLDSFLLDLILKKESAT